MASAESLAARIRGSSGLVLVAADALAREAGIPPRPASTNWATYGPRMRRIHATEPGPGHLAARRLQDLGLLDAVVSDSDDVLFDEAGVRDVVALAGSVELSVCPDCGYNEPLGCLLDLLPSPRCAACGGTLHPDVVAAGEPPRAEAMTRAGAAMASAGLVVVADDRPADGPLRQLCDETDAPVVVLGADAPGALLGSAVRQLGA